MSEAQKRCLLAPVKAGAALMPPISISLMFSCSPFIKSYPVRLLGSSEVMPV
jgi:hypothetical protein